MEQGREKGGRAETEIWDQFGEERREGAGQEAKGVLEVAVVVPEEAGPGAGETKAAEEAGPEEVGPSETEAGHIEVREEAAEGAQKEAAVEETAGKEGATRRGKMIGSCERRGEQQI